MIEFIEEVPREEQKCSRQEFRRTLALINRCGNRGNYLKNGDPAIRRQADCYPACCDDGKWRQS